MKTHRAKLKEKPNYNKRYRLHGKKEDYLMSEYDRQLERVNNRFSWPEWIQKN